MNMNREIKVVAGGLVLALMLVVGFFALFPNIRAKTFGGTITIELPPGKKLVTATWKESNFWHLSRSMRPDEAPEVYEFVEESTVGIFSGKVVLRESAAR